MVYRCVCKTPRATGFPLSRTISDPDFDLLPCLPGKCTVSLIVPGVFPNVSGIILFDMNTVHYKDSEGKADL